MRPRNQAHYCAALLLVILLLLTSCGSGSENAATMRLIRTEGKVSVSDDAGKNVKPKENLGLYSGYEVKSQSAGFAWINLDDVKLAKLDENSKIAIEKKDKHLEIEIKSGSLFFNVTQPLKADETMYIRTASLIAGIRGTCGWVEVPDASHMNVYLLKGEVACAAGKTAPVTAGEVGRLDETAGTVTVAPFAQDAIPSFVRSELDGIPLDSIPKTLGTPEADIAPTPDPAADASAQNDAVTGQEAAYDGKTDDPVETGRSAQAQTQTGRDVPQQREQDTNYWDIYSSREPPSLSPKTRDQTPEANMSPSPSDSELGTPADGQAEPDAPADDPAEPDTPVDGQAEPDTPANEPAESDAPADGQTEPDESESDIP